jgi:hypothetical protein
MHWTKGPSWGVGGIRMMFQMAKTHPLEIYKVFLAKYGYMVRVDKTLKYECKATFLE